MTKTVKYHTIIIYMTNKYKLTTLMCHAANRWQQYRNCENEMFQWEYDSCEHKRHDDTVRSSCLCPPTAVYTDAGLPSYTAAWKTKVNCKYVNWRLNNLYKWCQCAPPSNMTLLRPSQVCHQTSSQLVNPFLQSSWICPTQWQIERPWNVQHV